MAKIYNRVAVYCGSSSAVDPTYLMAAREVGKMLAERGIGVVYGGGRVGLMGACADGALAAGGEVIGVITDKLVGLEVGHQGLTRLEVVRTMHQRKMLMAELSDAFIALPGGLGTFEELFEAATWTQLNDHIKPVGLLNINAYYDGLMAFLRQALELALFHIVQVAFNTLGEALSIVARFHHLGGDVAGEVRHLLGHSILIQLHLIRSSVLFIRDHFDRHLAEFLLRLRGLDRRQREEEEQHGMHCECADDAGLVPIEPVEEIVCHRAGACDAPDQDTRGAPGCCARMRHGCGQRLFHRPPAPCTQPIAWPR